MQLERLYDRDSTLTGVPTGFHDLDDLLLGLQPSTLNVLAARPGQGKTSLALGAALHCALVARKPVLFFSMEMGHLELTKRLLAAEAGIEARKLSTGKLSEHEWPKLHQAVGRLAEAPFFIDDNPHCTVMEMRAKARRTSARFGDLGLIVVDYLQLMSSSGRVESRQIEVSELSRGLKILARELDTPVLCLSQLNRQLEYRQDKRPMLADLRESGCLTADTELTLADGATVTMGALYESGAENIEVLTLDEHLRLVPGVMTHVFASGVKPVVRTAAGVGPPRHCECATTRSSPSTGGCRSPRSRPARASRRIASAASTTTRPRDTIPPAVWDYIERKGLMVMGMRAHDLVERLGADEGCHRVYERGVSRGLMRRIADELPDPYPRRPRRLRCPLGRSRRGGPEGRSSPCSTRRSRARTTSSPTASSRTTASNRTPTSCCSSTATSTTTPIPTSGAWPRSSCPSTATDRRGRPGSPSATSTRSSPTSRANSHPGASRR